MAVNNDNGNMTQARTIKLIANPTAGRAGGKKLELAASYLSEKGVTVDICITQKRGDALEAARSAASSSQKPDMAVACGGDGTINEVVNGLAGSAVPLGVIPLGTVNLYVMETGIPMDLRGACDVLLKGEVKRIRLGKVNGRYFLLMAGVGFDADVVYRLDLALKKKLGKVAYVLTGLGRLASYRYDKLEIEIDSSRKVQGYSVVVGNMKFYGGRVSITPHADFSKNQLDICVFKGKGALNMLKYTFGVMMGKHLGFNDVEYVSARSLKISSARKAYIQIDGDSCGSLPAELSKTEECLSVVLPGKDCK